MVALALLEGVLHGVRLEDRAGSPAVLDAPDEQPAALVRVRGLGVPLNLSHEPPAQFYHASPSPQKSSLR